MKILVFGSTGFIGRNLVLALSKNHQVYQAARKATGNHSYKVDLLNEASIVKVLDKVEPDIIINTAGIVSNGPEASQNVVFTMNILRQAAALKNKPKRIIISGSAAEYGQVSPEDIPVSEDAKLNAQSPYALAKLQETTAALDFAKKNNLNVIVARIFNPIGIGMQDKFLIPALIRQVHEIESGSRKAIEVSRLDSRRDYIDIQDLVSAIVCLAEGSPKELIYNVGCGKSTSNAELINELISAMKLKDKPSISETSNSPEPLVAIQADISRISSEFGWKPKVSLKNTVKGIVHASS